MTKIIIFPDMPEKETLDPVNLKQDNDSSSGGEPPRGNDLEKRVENLEKALPDIRDRLTRLEVKIDSIEKHGATKDDISKLQGAVKNDISRLEVKMAEMQTNLIKWFIATAMTMSGLVCAITFGISRLFY